MIKPLKCVLKGFCEFSPLQVDESYLKVVKHEMTFRNPAYIEAERVGRSIVGIQPYLHMFVEKDSTISVPRSYAKDFETIVDKRSEGRRLSAEVLSATNCMPRNEEQRIAIETIFETLKREEGTILVAPCGKGKTVMGIRIAQLLGVSCVVLVHKEYLMKQWGEELKEKWPGCKVGIIRQGVFATGDTHDVVLAMTQSLLARVYQERLYESFGLIITDEVHRHAAPVWFKAGGLFSAKWQLGLTATPQRKDGLHTVFEKQLGKVGYRIETPDLVPEVFIVHTGCFIRTNEYTNNWNGRINESKLITKLSLNDDRNGKIVQNAISAIKKGRKVIVFSARLEHLRKLKRTFDLWKMRDCADATAGFYIGGKKDAELKEASKADLILATYQMAEEGLNIPDMDTVILGTPKGNVEQPIGRILRSCDEKKSPIVVDLVDELIDKCHKLSLARRSLYKKLNYKVN